MSGGGQNASPMGVNPSAFSGPLPMFGGGTPPSMTPTPPINPTPAPPQPQTQPAVMPPYGGYEALAGGYQRPDFMAFRPDMVPADRMPQQDMFGRGRSGFREPPMGGPTWSQQGGIFNYNPMGRPEGMSPLDRMRSRGPDLGMDPRQQMMPRYRPQSGPPQTAPQQAVQEPPTNAPGMRPGSAGLGAINPYAPKG